MTTQQRSYLREFADAASALTVETEPYWFVDLGSKSRRSMASKGVALPDGSFPIPNVAYLKKAMRAIGRAKDRAKAVAHIRSRAKALGAEKLLTPAFQASEAAAYQNISLIHNVEHTHTDGTTHIHPHAHSSDHNDPGSHDITLHSGHHRVLRQYDDAMIYTDLVAGSIHDLGTDNTAATAAELPSPLDDMVGIDDDVDGGDPDALDENGDPFVRVKSGEPSPSDVHVNVPINSGKQRKQRPPTQADRHFFDDPSQSFCGGCSGTSDTFCDATQQRFCSAEMASDADGYVPGDDDEDDLPPHLAFPTMLHSEQPALRRVLFAPGAPAQPAAIRNLADLCGGTAAQTATSRLFVELRKNALDEVTKGGNRIPYLPKPGIYTHPKYGTIVITRERNQRFVENINAHVYQSRLPLDLEHEGKLSGAAAWITSATLNSDGSADAFVELEPMGEKMLKENRYLFISPEWWEEWTQPHTGHAFQDIAIGGALVTRPFYKDDALRSLVASERGITVIDRVAPAQRGGSQVTSPQQPRQMSEEDYRQFVEMKTRLEATEAQNKQFAELLEAEKKTNAETAKKFAEREKSIRHQTFTDEVMGHSRENGTRWFIDLSEEDGKPRMDVAGHVAFMEKLVEAFGEDSPELKLYIEQNRQHARMMEQSALTRTYGAPGMQTSDNAAGGGRMAAAIKRFKDADPKITAEQAMDRAMVEDPSLYDEYLKANPRQHG